jgi:hypothetical protein
MPRSSPIREPSPDSFSERLWTIERAPSWMLFRDRDMVERCVGGTRPERIVTAKPTTGNRVAHSMASP